MAKSAAERKRESRENKLKQSGKKDITFSLDTAVIDNVTSHSKELGINQSDYVNDKLKGNVTSHDNELQAELEKYKAANFQLVIERDKLTIETQKLSRITQAIDYRKILDGKKIEELKKEIDDLNRKLNAGTGKACQCVTSNGTQCTRPAFDLIQTNDVLLWVCKQHRTSKYPNAPRA